MKCVICKAGETRDGVATVTLERDAITVVVKQVPAQVCDVCGEEYVDEATTADLLRVLDDAAKSGVHVDVRDFVAA